jgi:Uma2 family endonuclease
MTVVIQLGTDMPTVRHAPLLSPTRRAELMRMAAPTFYTAEMVRALPDDGNRYETVHGELLVTPAPRALHQRLVTRLIVSLHLYLERFPVGETFVSPADISWSSDVLVQPDVFVVDLAEARTLDWTRMQHLLLAIEVLSPSSVRADRFTKRRLYQEVGVPTYWVVDADAREVEVWTPADTFPTIERQRVTWQPSGAEALKIELAELFKPL